MNQITEFRTPAPSPAQALLHSSGIHQEKIREEEYQKAPEEGNQGAPEEGNQGAPEETQGVPE